MLERLAKWYLKRRGIIVLERAFVGVAIGNTTMVREGLSFRVQPNHGQFDEWYKIIALNHSVVMDQ